MPGCRICSVLAAVAAVYMRDCTQTKASRMGIREGRVGSCIGHMIQNSLLKEMKVEKSFTT